MENELETQDQTKFDEMLELSKAEAALALAVHFGCAPPEWARDRFEASLDGREENDAREGDETDTWVSRETLYEHALIEIKDISLNERLEAEEKSAANLLSEHESVYSLIELRAVFGISAHAVVITSGFSFTEIKRQVLGYVDFGGAMDLLLARGVIGEDFRTNGVRALPAFRDAVSTAVGRCNIGSNPNARGANAGMMNAGYKSLRLSAARAFAEDYISQNRCLPIGDFDIVMPYGPDQRVQSHFKSNSGTLTATLTFSEA